MFKFKSCVEQFRSERGETTVTIDVRYMHSKYVQETSWKCLPGIDMLLLMQNNYAIIMNT